MTPRVLRSLVTALIGAAGVVTSLLAQSAAPVPLRQVAFLKASNAQAGDHFGNGGTLLGDSVAISGDGNTIAVGAPNESGGAKGINGAPSADSLYSAGAVYVFARNGNTWAQQAYIKASNPRMGAEFGHVVAISADGNTLAVSATGDSSNATGVNGNQADSSIPQAGAVYVFVRTGTRWTQQAFIKASNTGEAGVGDNFGDGDQFGFSLALSDEGNTLAVGANSEDSNATGINGNQQDNSAQTSGAVYVFVRSAATWAQQAYIKASPIEAGAGPVGPGPPTGPPTAGPGGPGGPPGAGPGPGGPGFLFGTQFGYAVALSADGNTLAVGEFDEGGGTRGINSPKTRGRPGSGAVYVFTRAAATWSQQAYIKTSNADPQDSLGAAVALSDDGDTLLAGAIDEDCLATGVNPSVTCTDDSRADTSAGAAYVFVRNGTAWSEQAFIKASNTGSDDWFGARLAISGDGNTIAVAAQLEDSNAKGINGGQNDNSAQEAGAVYAFRRTGMQWTQLAYVKGSNTEAFDEFGSALALSRDGATMLVGARGEDSAARRINGSENDNSAAEAGAAYLFTIAPRVSSVPR